MTLDLAYPIKTGRRTCLPWSLRSVQANLAVPTGRLFIFGPKQRGIDAVLVKMKDREVKALNLQRKYQAMIDSELSDPFLLLDDDHVFMRPTSDVRLRTWGTLPEHIAKHGEGNYGINARNALFVLRSHGLDERNYQVHFPMLIEKETLQRTLDMARDTPILMASVYGNVSEQPSVEVDRDNKLNLGMDVREFLETRPFVSLSDKVEKMSMTSRMLNLRFPLPSRWEVGVASHSARIRRAKRRK